MAYQTGTAANMDDFFTEVVAFATANGWSDVGSGLTDGSPTVYDGEYIFLKSTGFSDNDDIVVSLQKRQSADSQWLQLRLQGHPNYAAGQAPSAQNGSTPTRCFFAYPNANAIYHIMVNAERIMWLIFSGSHYSMGYVGYMRAYAPRSSYPKPYLLIGNTNQESNGTDGRWADNYISSFPTTFKAIISNSDLTRSAWASLDELGDWSAREYPSPTVHMKPDFIYSQQRVAFLPYDTSSWKEGESSPYGMLDEALNFQGTVDGSPVLMPVIHTVRNHMLGDVWGCMMPMKSQLSSGDTIIDGSDSYLVTVPAAAVNAKHRYLAVRLA